MLFGQPFNFRSRFLEAVQGLIDPLIAGMSISPNHLAALVPAECLDGSGLGAGFREFGNGGVAPWTPAGLFSSCQTAIPRNNPLRSVGFTPDSGRSWPGCRWSGGAE